MADAEQIAGQIKEQTQAAVHEAVETAKTEAKNQGLMPQQQARQQ